MINAKRYSEVKRQIDTGSIITQEVIEQCLIECFEGD